MNSFSHSNAIISKNIASLLSRMLSMIILYACCAKYASATYGEVSYVAGQLSNPGKLDGVGTYALLGEIDTVGVANGRVYFGDKSNKLIRFMDITTKKITTIAGDYAGTSTGIPGNDGIGTNAVLDKPSGFSFSPDGNILYFCESSKNVVRSMDLTTSQISTIAGVYGDLTGEQMNAGASFSNGIGTLATFFYPYDTLPLNGILYVTDMRNNALRAINPATKDVVTVAGGISGNTNGFGTFARFNKIGHMIQARGLLIISDQSNNIVRSVDTANGYLVSTLAGSANNDANPDGVGTYATFILTMGLAFDGASTIYVGDNEGDKIRALNLDTLVVTTVTGGASTGSFVGIGNAVRFGYSLFDLAYDNGILYVAAYYSKGLLACEVLLPPPVTVAPSIMGQTNVPTSSLTEVSMTSTTVSDFN
jgi:hypothetical protein